MEKLTNAPIYVVQTLTASSVNLHSDAKSALKNSSKTISTKFYCPGEKGVIYVGTPMSHLTGITAGSFLKGQLALIHNDDTYYDGQFSTVNISYYFVATKKSATTESKVGLKPYNDESENQETDKVTKELKGKRNDIY